MSDQPHASEHLRKAFQVGFEAGIRFERTLNWADRELIDADEAFDRWRKTGELPEDG